MSYAPEHGVRIDAAPTTGGMSARAELALLEALMLAAIAAFAVAFLV